MRAFCPTAAALQQLWHNPPMKKLALCVAATVLLMAHPRATLDDAAGWEREAQNVTIVRDTWGIPHVHGKTDADAVFGVVFAQAEDDFNRVETNFVNAMGRLAEAEGESEVVRDLRMKLFIDPDELKADYDKSPDWLKRLMNAWADGLNYYLHTHPNVHPRVVSRFEPWMALSFTEGSIGGDIERVNLASLEKFYSVATSRSRPQPNAGDDPYVEPTGSNGIAIAPSNTVGHHALLLINPHTSFFFRAEAQMASDEGLDAYGAMTWGQFFVYQGFNDRAGWMHTSSGVDNIDEYLETVTQRSGSPVYRYGSEERPVTVRHIVVPYKTATGMARKDFTVYATHHGPIVREQDGKWVSVRLMQDPIKALIQSYSRTKARSYTQFKESMELHTNSSNNTIYADADGNIAYFHSNFIPKRDSRFDWTRPVDGADPATEWKQLMSVDETPHLLNPPNGWLYNSNNWPWSAAGPNSPKRADYPAYVDRGAEESPRGYHALRVLDGRRDFTVDRLIAAAYDSYLPAFERQIPALLKAWDGAPPGDPVKTKVSDQIAVLRTWDYRWGVDSVPTSLAVYWGEDVARRVADQAKAAGVSTDEFVAHRAAPATMLASLVAAAERLTADFGTWRTPWGHINRYQRLTGDIVQRFDDGAPSLPVGFTSSRWGSLASFGARTYDGTKKMYGTTGNSFVAVVEFGDRVRAKAITAGGESGDPRSPHFGDQAERYSTGDLREVYFYPDQLQGHIERQYHPGAASAAAAVPQRHANDGVTINDEGLPQYSTFSLCAIDPATGQSGAAVTTRVPFVGRAVPWVRAGVGAVCTQASTVVEYGPRGLDLLAKGSEPQAVLAQLLSDDRSRESRQVGVIDMKGRSAAHTGKETSSWAGSRQGRNYTVQANTMVGPEVVDAVANTFEATEGTGMPLAERMILAIEAGHAKGGDRRWGNLQSAAIKIADPRDPGRGGDFISLAIEVGENPEPVAELKRIYYTTARRLGYRSFSSVEGPDVVELKRMLHGLGYWRPSLEKFPDAPASTATADMRELQRRDPAQYERLVAESRRAIATYNEAYAAYDAETIAAVDKFRADKKLDFQGDPPGLVDQRLIDALRSAYYARKTGGSR